MPSPVVFDLQPYIAQLSGAVALVAAVVLTVLKLNRTASKNQTEIGQDKASQNILTVALRQRDEALKAAETAWAQRHADAVAIATFTEREKVWIEDKVRLTSEYMELESLCRRAARRMHSLDPESAALMFPSDWITFDPNPHLGHLKGSA